MRTTWPLILAAIVCFPAAAEAAGGPDAGESEGLVSAFLEASGVGDPGTRAYYEALFEERISPIVADVLRIESPRWRARRLHEELHEKLFRRYRFESGGLDQLIDSGDYNCVSASLTYAIAARRAHLDARIVESPRHVFVRLGLGKRTIDVETTSPDGFPNGPGRLSGVGPDVHHLVQIALYYKLVTPAEVRDRGEEAVSRELLGTGVAVEAEEGLAFAWHDRAVRALERSEGLEAARCFAREVALHPQALDRSESLLSGMAKAYRIAYDRGAFDEAYEIATLDLSLVPERRSAVDRLIAAAIKRIEIDCEKDLPASARAVLDDAHQRTTSHDDLARLDRSASPLIAAASVRIGNWTLAQAEVERYSLAEPDPVEAARLPAWVDSRRRATEQVSSDGHAAVTFP